MGYFDKLNEIGTFEVKSNKLFISDPCYDHNTWCAQSVSGVKNGIWNAYVQKADCGMMGDRIARLYAVHENTSINDLCENSDDLDNLGVDSGQMGIFDYDMFKNDDQFPKDFAPEFAYHSDELELFYRACCDITLSRESAGVIPNGCVCSSGYGDGVYCGFVYSNDDNEVIGIEIVFLEEGDCDDDEDDENGEDKE